MFEPSPLFWYKLIFMAELLVAEWMYSFCLKKRKKYVLRRLGGIAICFAAAAVFPLAAFNAIYSSFMFFVLSVVSVSVMKLCYDEPWRNIIFRGLAAYITRHIAYTLYDLVLMLLGISEGLLIGIYGEDATLRFNVFTAVVYVNCYFFTYWILLILMGTRLKKYDELVLSGLSFLVLATFIVFVDIVLNAFVVYHSYTSFEKTYLIYLYLYNVLCSLSAFVIQFGMVNRKIMQNKIDVLGRLWKKDREQYIIAKDNIDRVNVLCHDLKYRLRCLESKAADREELSRMEEIIFAYDTKVKTGNNALDVILTEKSLSCRKKGIEFMCMADGSALSFMEDADIYSLFGNALDNAIEASVGVADAEKRIVGAVAKKVDGFLSVNIYNYCENEPKFRDGFPVTSKKDKENHGFGVRSIAMITEKYGGDLSINAKDGIFDLNLLFHVGMQDSARNG
ncbi:MAG: GHKL domain-containing protein [Clostridia bacterium]|nr:GHKL domain-containing protein [Clostridia bacterium]